MKRIVQEAVFLVVFLVVVNNTFSQTLTIVPRYPQRGQDIKITYYPGTPGSKIPKDAKEVNLVFTYSNLYSVPLKIHMVPDNGTWACHFNLPVYAVFATFYLQSDTIQEQPSENQQYEIAVYDHDSVPVEKGLLYKSYSLGAQMHYRSKIAEAQKALLQKELTLYPEDYEAKLRLISNRMNHGGKQDREALLNKGNALIADKYNKDMPNMETLNLVTMGYLILGENSRLDSIHDVTIKRYPSSAVAKELLFSKIARQYTDTPELARHILKELETETASNREGFGSYHEMLFQYYAGKKQGKKALSHAEKMLFRQYGPHYPVSLKNIAATLSDKGIEPDSAIVYARHALALLDSFPVGLVRYFAEYGYMPSYADEATKKKERDRQHALLLSIIGQSMLAKGNRDMAGSLADSALALSGDEEEVLTRTAKIFTLLQRPERAYSNYRSLFFHNPLDTTVMAPMKTAFVKWKGSANGWPDTLSALTITRRTAKTNELKKMALNTKGPSLAGIVDMQGNPLAAESLKGKVLVIDFWATWCVPCMHEMPYLQKVYDKYKNNKDVAFLIVNSGARNTLADAQQWAKRVDYSFPVYFHTNPNVGDLFGFNVIPALYVMDGKGNLQYKTIGFEGPSTEETLDLKIELLLH